MVQRNQDFINVVIQLTRDHDLMRRMIGQIKDLLSKNEMDERMVALMDALLIVDFIHNEDEMNNLVGPNER